MDERTGEKSTLLSCAVECALAGYPVIPCRPGEKARRTRKGTKPTARVAQVRRWWTRMPDSNIGVVLKDVHMVVIDVDGPEGESSLLRLLDLAGLDVLPETFTVTTGRPEGGRHLWYRLPEGASKLVGQYGKDYPETPHLDVLSNGLVMAPGSVHKSGAVYTGSTGIIPTLADLAEIPQRLYEVLHDRRKNKGKDTEQTQRPSKATEGAVDSPGGQSVPRVAIDASDLPTRLRAMLDDTSHGRNGRTLKAITWMVKLGLKDEVIIEHVLASPLGDKAREQWDPQGWLEQKIPVAREWAGRDLDKAQYWWSFHSAGLSTGEVRVLDFVLAKSSASGVFTGAADYIGLGAALKRTKSVLTDLQDKGWLLLLREYTASRSCSYLLSFPQQEALSGQVQEGPDGLPTSPPHQCGLYGTFPVDLIGHDAFRHGQATLSTAYPLLALLTDQPQPRVLLAQALRLSDRAMGNRVRALIDSGVATESEEGLALTPDDLEPLLDDVAARAGTQGTRARVRAQLTEDKMTWAASRKRSENVGSDEWIAMKRRDYREKYERQIEEGYLPTDADVDALVEEAVHYEHDAEVGKAGKRFRVPSRSLL